MTTTTATQADVDGLTHWQALFGADYLPLFVFMYRVMPTVTLDDAPDVWRHRDEAGEVTVGGVVRARGHPHRDSHARQGLRGRHLPGARSGNASGTTTAAVRAAARTG